MFCLRYLEDYLDCKLTRRKISGKGFDNFTFLRDFSIGIETNVSPFCGLQNKVIQKMYCLKTITCYPYLNHQTNLNKYIICKKSCPHGQIK